MNKEINELIQEVNRLTTSCSSISEVLSSLAAALERHLMSESVKGFLQLEGKRISFSPEGAKLFNNQQSPNQGALSPMLRSSTLIVTPIVTFTPPNFYSEISISSPKVKLTDELAWFCSLVFARLLASEAAYSAANSAIHDTSFYCQNTKQSLKSAGISALEESFENLERKVSQLGNYRRMVSLPLEDDREELNLKTEIEECVRPFLKFFSTKSLKLSLDLSETQVFLSKKLLFIYLENVIANAIKHSKQKSVVTVKNSKDSITVSNFSEDPLQNLDKQISSAVEGGLYIMKTSASMLRGKVETRTGGDGQLEVSLELN